MMDKIELSLILLARPVLDRVNLPNRDSADDILDGLLGVVYIVAGLVAVISIVVGGFWYVTSNGEPEKTKRGKNAIIYASVGLVFVMMAWVITGFVSSRIGV